MTAICTGGGASQAKPGFGLSVAMSAAALAARFANTAGWMSAFIAAYIGGITYDLSTFCTTDPPAVPALTAADFVALVTFLDPIGHLQAQAKIQQWIGAMVWYDLCECVAGAQPVAPTPAGPPVNLPSVNPVAVTPNPQVTTSCRTVSNPPLTMTSGQSFFRGAPSTVGLPVSNVQVTVTNAIVSGGGLNVDLTAQWQKQVVSGPVVLGDTYVRTVLAGGSTVFQAPMVPGFEALQLKLTAAAGAGVASVTLVTDMFCNGPIPGGSKDCCPPDPGLLAQIDGILQMVTLIQRQIVPFAYVPGAVHTGLSGSGVLSVSGLLGAKIVITTDPSSLGREGTSPEILFDRGFITWGTPDGYPQSERLHRTSQLSLPVRCSAFTDLAYDLHPGVVVTITELVREK